MKDILIGVALGQPHEPGGLVVVHRHEELAGWSADARRWNVRVSYKGMRSMRALALESAVRAHATKLTTNDF